MTTPWGYALDIPASVATITAAFGVVVGWPKSPRTAKIAARGYQSEKNPPVFPYHIEMAAALGRKYGVQVENAIAGGKF
jgi:hypothetical protein